MKAGLEILSPEVPIYDRDIHFDTYTRSRTGHYGIMPSGVHTAALAFLGQEASELDTLSAYIAAIHSGQEDIVVMDHEGRMVFVGVDFPSGWDPDKILGSSWTAIHAPVPGFNTEKIAAMMIQHQLTQRSRRSVWTVTTDPNLDHRPSKAPRPWSDTTEVWFRSEVQTTVPVQGGAIFLIRTYVNPVSDCSLEQLTVLKSAIGNMPSEIARYKNIDRQRVLSLLNQIYSI